MNKVKIMSRKIFLSISVLVFSAISLAVLVKYNDTDAEHKAGFSRFISAKPIAFLISKKKDVVFNDIVGKFNDNVFLVNYKKKSISLYDSLLNIVEDFPLTKKIDFETLGPYELSVNNITVHLFQKNSPYFTEFRVRDTSIYIKKAEHKIVTKVLVISENKSVARAFDSSGTSQNFRLINNLDGRTIATGNYLSDKGDMGFSSDGILAYDKLSNRILYVQYYNNKFICLDSTLNLLYESKTIDTLHNNNVKVKVINRRSGAKSLMPTVPLKYVSNYAACYDGRLLILSNVKSDDQSVSIFEGNFIIDVYSVDDGRYLFSFFIRREHDKLIRFKIVDDKIVILYTNSVFLYRLHF
jgi:hypothetical protein